MQIVLTCLMSDKAEVRSCLNCIPPGGSKSVVEHNATRVHLVAKAGPHFYGFGSERVEHFVASSKIAICFKISNDTVESRECHLLFVQAHPPGGSDFLHSAHSTLLAVLGSPSGSLRDEKQPQASAVGNTKPVKARARCVKVIISKFKRESKSLVFTIQYRNTRVTLGNVEGVVTFSWKHFLTYMILSWPL